LQFNALSLRTIQHFPLSNFNFISAGLIITPKPSKFGILPQKWPLDEYTLAFFLQFFVGAKPQVRCHVKKISVINIKMWIYDAHNRQHLEFLVLFTLRGDSYEFGMGAEVFGQLPHARFTRYRCRNVDLIP